MAKKKHTIVEKIAILKRIQTDFKGNTLAASRELGISNKTLHAWKNELNLRPQTEAQAIEKAEKIATDVGDLLDERVNFANLERLILQRIKATIPLQSDSKKLAETYRILQEIKGMSEQSERQQDTYNEIKEFLVKQPKLKIAK